jgi:molybdopterin synthase sulfur carrier subunit
MPDGTIAETATATVAGQRLTVRYFAWVREKVGRAEETIVVPDGIATVRDLVAWLAAREVAFFPPVTGG